MSNEIQIPIEQLSGDIVPIETPNSFKLSVKERKLAVLIASREANGLTIDQCYDLAGYSSRSAGWKARNKNEFKLYVEELLDNHNREQLGLVYDRLHKIIKQSKSEKNQLEAIKIFLTLTGKMKDSQEITHKFEDQVYDYEEKRKEILDLEIEE